jgi:hypothetical protein
MGEGHEYQNKSQVVVEREFTVDSKHLRAAIQDVMSN